MAHELGRNQAGEAAAFLASDRASTMTVAAVNITCGQLAD
jgi:hypothetical protein